MRRRELAAGLGSLLLAPFVARARQPTSALIGLSSGTGRDPRIVGATLEGLAGTGLTEGRDFTVEFRGAEGRFE